MANYSQKEIKKLQAEYNEIRSKLKEAGKLPKAERKKAEKPEWWSTNHTTILNALKPAINHVLTNLNTLFDKTKLTEIDPKGKHLGLVGIQFNVSDTYSVSIVNKNIKEARTNFLESQKEKENTK